MTENDLETFEQVMQTLNEIFGDTGKPVSDMKMRIYFQALQDLPIKDVEASVPALSKTKTIRTFPLPAEVREATRGNIQDQAVAAFDVLLNAIQRHGFYQSVEFRAGIIGKCVDALGGWAKVCEWTVDERKWNRREFEKLYRAYSVTGVVGPVKCVGEFERINAQKGHDIKPQVAIGDDPKGALSA